MPSPVAMRLRGRRSLRRQLHASAANVDRADRAGVSRPGAQPGLGPFVRSTSCLHAHAWVQGARRLTCWLLLSRRGPALVPALALMSAYASHLLLDWLSKDTSPPSGLTLLWPLSWTYYQSPWTLFGEISRRYWLPHEFIVRNILAALWELVVLIPVLLAAWIWWSRRTLRSDLNRHRTPFPTPDRVTQCRGGRRAGAVRKAVYQHARAAGPDRWPSEIAPP